jgi:hypothetical protein
MLPHGARDMVNALQMFSQSFVEDKYIIKIYDHEIIYEQPHDIVHHPHESCWSIFQAKRHDQQLEKALFRLEVGYLDTYELVKIYLA